MTAEMFQRSALDGRESDLARIGAREVPFPAQLSVRTRTSEAFGLPAEPNTWSSLDEATDALWLGPDEWLVVSSASRGAVDAAFGDAASLVDVSANRVLIDLRRDDAYDPRDLLEQGCSLDLDPRAWNEGMCAQTLLAHVPVILQERETGTRMFVRPSFANWLVDWLLAVSS
ncbi:MAG TPA: sarcosine oxidase subunit gamma family protein [Actinomycetota bacterium]|nr:sarcosine oxidase subunit gamma family protein [Actinomycetota bacterium]